MDIGAGAGSIGIEWMLAHPSMRAMAIEHHAERVARIRAMPLLRRAGLAGGGGQSARSTGRLPAPDVILSAAVAARMACWRRHLCLPTGGGWCQCVTLEMERVLLDAHARLGGRLIRLSVDRAEPVGPMTGWRAAMR